MLSIAPFVVASALFIGSFASATLNCDALLGKDPVKIDDLLQVQNTSRLKDNFKLPLVYLFQALEHQYGPLNLKPATTGINWDQMKIQTLRAASKWETSNDQYYAIADFMAKFNDAHVSVQLPSTLTYKVPLQFQMAENRFFVAFISDKFPGQIREPARGDELIAINGLTPDEFQKQFPQFNSSGNSLTNKALFGLKLSGLSEAGGFPLSKLDWKDISLSFRSRNNPKESYTIRVPFEVQGIGLIGKDMDGKDPNPPIIASLNNSKENDPSSQYAPKTTSIIRKALALFKTEASGIVRDLDGQKHKENGKGHRLEIGGFEPFFKLPADFKPITIPDAVMADPKFASFFSPTSFNAGTFERNGKRVGFLRIPSYSADSVGAIATTIRYFIGKLQAESDYLVIDQTNNPGGMVIMSDMLLKALNGKYDYEKHMRFAVKPSQKFIREYRELRDEIAKNEDQLFTDAEVKEVVDRLDVEYNKIYKAYVEGRDLSEPVSMLALSEYSERSFDKAMFRLPWGPLFEAMLGVNIQKHQVYTKPVYFMINELDFSGGDATPAGFQDYGRGYLVGTRANSRTAGAGGTVENFSLRSALEVHLSWTTSLMVRFKGYLVENYGVKADINVPLTSQDIAEGNENYFPRVLTAIENHMATHGSKQKP